MSDRRIMLVGDVGGTKVNLALCEVQDGRFVTREHRRFASREYSSLAEIVRAYAPSSKIDGACFGVPGPVIDGRCKTVNLPWVLDAKELQAATGIQPICLINDLEAMARGVQTLAVGRGLAVLREPPPGHKPGNQALIAPGTGLGEAIMIWDGTRHIVSASEGGHTDFGPQDEEQIELLRWLWPRHAHASWEHVCSGSAIYRIYRFLAETGREIPPADLVELLNKPGTDPSPVLAARALAGSCAISVRALDLWLFCLGAETGNLALKVMGRGGLFIGGGIVAHVAELFRRPAFFKGFEGKGRISAVLRDIPIYAVTDNHTALYGAAIAAYTAL